MADQDAITPRRLPGIYTITNTMTGGVYVGSSHDVHRRWRAHRHQLKHGKHHSRRLQRAWNKLGEEHFVFAVMEAVPDLDLLLSREQHWIDTLEAFSRHKGYNMYPTPHGRRGAKASDELRAKLSALRKGKKKPPFSAEHRAMIADARRGTKATPEQRAQMSAMRKGKKRSGTALINIRAALVLRNKSPELREANRERLKRFPIARRTVADPRQTTMRL